MDMRDTCTLCGVDPHIREKTLLGEFPLTDEGKEMVGSVFRDERDEIGILTQHFSFLNYI